ncbi:MAG: glycosyltransferase family 2 protein [Lachnospiraceae bacterium]|nr:glycosyltransferase family 2 protein [Lachnospiraceae bacterium]
MKPKVGIVIVNYNGLNYQNEAIRSIKEQTYSNYEIIVVDNNSTDGSIKELKKEFEDVHVIETGDNLGVAAGNNIGILYALKLGAEYVMLLNNDIILSTDLMEILVEKASEQVITVPKIFYYDKKKIIWSAGGYVDWKTGTPHHIGLNQCDGSTFRLERYVEIAPTCCMLIHKNVFKHVGKMDERYFMYYDDTDFCVRANLKGYKILYVPSAVMWHKVNSSSGGLDSKITRYYCARNILYFMDKYKYKIKDTKRERLKCEIKYILENWMVKKNVRYSLVGFIDYFRGRMYRKDF